MRNAQQTAVESYIRL